MRNTITEQLQLLEIKLFYKKMEILLCEIKIVLLALCRMV